MTDFVPFDPSARSELADGATSIRVATSADVEGVAWVMHARGRDLATYREQSHPLIERLPVLVAAERDSELVGYSGAQLFVIEPGRGPEWLFAGLTVVPAQRRRGVAARLLREVLEKVHRAAPAAPVFSVINAQNLASLRLHEAIGFEEIGGVATYARIDFTGGEGVLLRNW